ncbi:iron complex outermembrane receptor protein [Nitrosomonas nitrosa]|uniref:TonB-dependent receptor n=1 Tax=Nitrosomonas nitrosa TaxID=52442 RepID=UPI000D30F9F9|nr:TonB-dependent receptor [Nitrosomonas nitrosa]PTQ97134.1 iron complex outermembrane receptor protein [Nitrosomonas nitrosa]
MPQLLNPPKIGFPCRKIRLSRLIVGILITFCYPIAQAEEKSKAIKLREIVITSTPFQDRSELNMTQPTTVLHGDNLRRKREVTLGDTLSTELGVASSSFGPGAGRPIIRALDGPRIQVLENGIGTLDISSLSPDHAVTIETLNASQVEILRGPATLLYGGGATGGVVNAVTQRIPNQVFKSLNGNFEVRGNSATEERTGSFNLNRSFGQTSWSIGAFKRKTDDYNIPGHAFTDTPLQIQNKQANNRHESEDHHDHGQANGHTDTHENAHQRKNVVRNSAVDSQGLSLGGSYIGEKGFLGGSLSLLESKYGIPTLERPTIDLTQARYNIMGELDQPVTGLEKIKMRMGYNDYKHDEIEANGELGTRFKNRELETRTEFLHAPIASLKGLFGIQFQDRTFSALGEEAIVPITKSRSTGLFLIEERNWDKFRFEFGGRYEYATRNPQNDVDRARAFGLFNGSAGAFWNFIQDYNLGLTATHGQRAPALEELYVNGAHHATGTFQMGDSTLHKEATNNIDLSLSKSMGFIKWKVNAFYNRFNNYIFFKNVDIDGDGIADRVDDDGMLNPGGEFQALSIAQTHATFYGAEAEVILTLRPDNLDLRLFTDYVRAKLDNKNGNVPRTTPQRFGLELNYKKEPWTANITAIHVLRQTKLAELETETPGYTLLNLEASYRIKETKTNGIRLFVQGRNLLNEEMRVHTSFLKNFAPLPGRALIAGIRGDF